MARQMRPWWLRRRRLLALLCALAAALSLTLSPYANVVANILPPIGVTPSPQINNPCVSLSYGDTHLALPPSMAPRELVMIHPVAADGVVYVDYPVLAADRIPWYTIAALRASDGTMLWSIPDTNSTSRLAYVDGKLILLGEDVVALRATDGTTLWQEPLRMYWAASLVYRNGILYYSNGATMRAVVYALRLADGHVLWQTSVGEITGPGPTVPVLDGNSLYIGVSNGAIAALRTDTGVIRWLVYIDLTHTNGSRPLAMIAGKLLIYAPGGNLFLNPADGGVEGDAPPPFDTLAAVDLLAVGGTSSAGLPFAMAWPYGLLASDGRLIWRLPTVAPGAISVIAYDADTLYLGPGPSVYYAIRMSDGAVRWSLRSSNTFRATGFAATPGYFFETASGMSAPCTPSSDRLPEIRALSSVDGGVVWTHSFDPALEPPPCATCHSS